MIKGSLLKEKKVRKALGVGPKDKNGLLRRWGGPEVKEDCGLWKRELGKGGI